MDTAPLTTPQSPTLRNLRRRDTHQRGGGGGREARSRASCSKGAWSLSASRPPSGSQVSSCSTRSITNSNRTISNTIWQRGGSPRALPPPAPLPPEVTPMSSNPSSTRPTLGPATPRPPAPHLGIYAPYPSYWRTSPCRILTEQLKGGGTDIVPPAADPRPPPRPWSCRVKRCKAQIQVGTSRKCPSLPCKCSWSCKGATWTNPCNIVNPDQRQIPTHRRIDAVTLPRTTTVLLGNTYLLILETSRYPNPPRREIEVPG